MSEPRKVMIEIDILEYLLDKHEELEGGLGSEHGDLTRFRETIKKARMTR